MSEASREEATGVSQNENQEIPPESVVAKPQGGGGIFKKRAKTQSAQKGLRRPVSTETSTIPTTLARVASDDDEDEEDYSSDDERGMKTPDILAGRKRKRGGIIQAGTTRASTSKGDLGVSYSVNRASNSETTLNPRDQATAVSAEFTEAELLGKPKTVTTSTESTADNLYRGQKNYRQLLPQKEQITTKYNPVGPQKAASNIRMTTYTDYAPG